MGRAGCVNDEIGSALIGARLVRDIMRTAFLLERQYPPYAKWFGTAFTKLACAPDLGPHLEAAIHARNWQERESNLSTAYEILVKFQRTHGIVDNTPGTVSNFWDRPFLVIHGDRIAEAVFSQITDPRLSFLAKSQRIGNVDLISDNTDILEDTSIRPLIRGLYES